MLTFLIALLLVAGDQLVKWWARVSLPNWPGSSMPVWDGIFHLTYVKNDGAAFSMLSGFRWVFVGFAVVVLILIALYVWKTKPGLLMRIALGLIAGGALGNMIDRIRWGYVEDMIEMRFLNFAIFNVADTCVTVGAILLGIWLLFIQGKSKTLKPMAGGSNE